ncbi:MAG: GntR family transcriptional regulator [Thermoplasmataceae archaeon]
MEQKITLSSRAYEYIYNNITQGKLRVGQYISEEMIANKLKISRTPIRESLIALNKEGLLEKTGRSYRVIIASSEDLIELYEARKVIEAESARLCALRINREQLSDFKKFMLDVNTTYSQSAIYANAKADLDDKFHEIIGRNSGNKYMEKYSQEIRRKLKIVRLTFFTATDVSMEDSREHESIFQAIMSREPSKAYEEMLKHEDNVIKYVKEELLPTLYKF